jgi:hypothetical protein
MPARLLLRRLGLLWVGIAIERIVLHVWVRAISPSVLNLASLIMSISVVVVELFILRAAGRDFAEQREPNQKAPLNVVKARGLFPRIFVGLMIFCLGFGLWQSQNQISAMNELAILVGTAANLLFTYGAALAILSTKQESAKVPSVQ